MGAPIKRLELSEEETTALRLLAASGTAAQRMAVRARVVLSAAEGLSLQEISKCTGLSVNACLQWRKRFAADRFEGLTDEPGRGRPQSITQEQRLTVIALACTKPLDGSTRWSMRKLADAIGYSVSTIHEILKAADSKPHKVKHWCGKNPDPEFTSKQTTIIGLYMEPPVNAIVLCVDEKSRIQILDRTQPLLSMRPGQLKRLTATDKPIGTTSLLAVFSVYENTSEGRCVERTNHANFLNFLRQLYRSNPGKEFHIVADNLSAHKHKDVLAWVEKRRRLSLHFAPTYASWLNKVEI